MSASLVGAEKGKAANGTRISVVVPVWNGEDTLEGCLQALDAEISNRGDCEIIVVDDGSSDRSASIAERFKVRIVRQSHAGAAAARNRGVREASGEAVAFVDADCEVQQRWLTELSRPVLQNGTSGSVGKCNSDQRHWVAALIQAELDERYSTMGHHTQVDFLNTGNCAFRRSLLEKQPFDESFLWLEDVELSFRLAEQGHRMVFAENALVLHPHPESLWFYLRRKFHYASCAPAIYRRFPDKSISDSRTPLSRRLQLVLLGLSLPAFLISGTLAIILMLGSAVLTFPVVRRAFRRSPALGLLAPFFVLAGNAAFTLGVLYGLFLQLSSRLHSRG